MEKEKKIRHLCFIRIDRMGDMILTLPVIEALKKKHPYLEITIISSKANRHICEIAPFIDKNITFLNFKNFFINVLMSKNNKQFKFDQIYNLSPSIKSFFILLLLKAKEKFSLIFLSRYSNKKNSKLLQRLFAHLFKIKTIIVDRNLRFKEKKLFHQTEMIRQLVLKKYNFKLQNEFLLPVRKKKFLFYNQKRIMIHASGKWIDKKYKEEKFLDLIEEISKLYGKIFITTDEKSESKFKKLFTKFKVIENFSKKMSNCLTEKIIILKYIQFEEWREIITASKAVITYECGCVHVSAMSGVPLIIIYDFENKPEMIFKEYHPWTKNFEKIICKQSLINQEILKKLKKLSFNT